MNDKRLFFNADKAGCVLGAVFLVTLTGCVGYVDGPRAEVYAPPPVVQVGVVVVDDYIYYPDYEVYYSSSRHRYAYREDNVWVMRSAPRGVTVYTLQSSRTVRMDFHDSPEHHHAEVVKQYPGNRKQPGARQGRNDERKGNQRNQQANNHGR